jgi:hypothetical protein
MVTELDIELSFAKEVESLGGLCVKLDPHYRIGSPDRLCIAKDKIVFVEVKKPGGVTADIQTYYRNYLESIGYDSYISTLQERERNAILAKLFVHGKLEELDIPNCAFEIARPKEKAKLLPLPVMSFKILGLFPEPAEMYVLVSKSGWAMGFDFSGFRRKLFPNEVRLIEVLRRSGTPSWLVSGSYLSPNMVKHLGLDFDKPTDFEWLSRPVKTRKTAKPKQDFNNQLSFEF